MSAWFVEQTPDLPVGHRVVVLHGRGSRVDGPVPSNRQVATVSARCRSRASTIDRLLSSNRPQRPCSH